MRRRKLLVLLAGVAVVVAGGVVALWLLEAAPSPVTHAHFEGLRVHMSRAQIRAILGAPQDCSTGPTTLTRGEREWHQASGHLENIQLSSVDVWLSDTAAITVFSGQDGVANAITFVPVTKTHQGLFENLLWRAKRQWHRWFPCSEAACAAELARRAGGTGSLVPVIGGPNASPSSVPTDTAR